MPTTTYTALADNSTAEFEATADDLRRYLAARAGDGVVDIVAHRNGRGLSCRRVRGLEAARDAWRAARDAGATEIEVRF